MTKIRDLRTMMRSRSKQGFTLVVMALSAIALIGVVGLAIDLGRMYVAKTESQTFVDSASIAATLELDGTVEGITRANQQLVANANTWNFGSKSFSSKALSFAKSKAGPWDINPVDPRGYRYARATTTVPVPIFFMPLLRNSSPGVVPTAMLLASPTFTASVLADSTGGQEPKTAFREGLFPFSPYAHNEVSPHFGLVPGRQYTLRWSAAARLNKNVCAGDNIQAVIDLSGANTGAERGFIESTSASVIRAAIEQDYQTVFRSIGDAVVMTGGAKGTMRDSLIVRVNQDRDYFSRTFAEYSVSGLGNGRRIVGVPINKGVPSYAIVQIAAFLLLPTDQYSDHGGNEPFCAEYIGAWVQGSQHKGAADGGSYAVRLVK